MAVETLEVSRFIPARCLLVVQEPASSSFKFAYCRSDKKRLVNQIHWNLILLHQKLSLVSYIIAITLLIYWVSKQQLLAFSIKQIEQNQASRANKHSTAKILEARNPSHSRCQKSAKIGIIWTTGIGMPHICKFPKQSDTIYLHFLLAVGLEAEPLQWLMGEEWFMP